VPWRLGFDVRSEPTKPGRAARGRLLFRDSAMSHLPADACGHSLRRHAPHSFRHECSDHMEAGKSHWPGLGLISRQKQLPTQWFDGSQKFEHRGAIDSAPSGSGRRRGQGPRARPSMSDRPPNRRQGDFATCVWAGLWPKERANVG